MFVSVHYIFLYYYEIVVHEGNKVGMYQCCTTTHSGLICGSILYTLKIMFAIYTVKIRFQLLSSTFRTIFCVHIPDGLVSNTVQEWTYVLNHFSREWQHCEERGNKLILMLCRETHFILRFWLQSNWTG
jgi:hypothetical protein